MRRPGHVWCTIRTQDIGQKCPEQVCSNPHIAENVEIGVACGTGLSPTSDPLSPTDDGSVPPEHETVVTCVATQC